MSATPTLLHWMIALGLLVLFAWIVLGLFWDLVPTPWNHADEPYKKVVALGLTTILGLLSVSLASPILDWVWAGLKHVLGMDMEGL